MSLQSSRLSRRKFVKELITATAVSPTLPNLVSSKLLANSLTPQRLILIYLDGGWNSHFATDPIIQEKSLSKKFQPIFLTEPITSVPGKSNLVVGSGWTEATAAFAMVPTCFINGISLEITVHEIGMELMVAGLSSSLRSDAPCNVITSILGERMAFPEHIILGSDFPIRSAKRGLSGSDIEDIVATLKSPHVYNSSQSWDVAQNMVKALNAEYRSRLSGNAKIQSEKWENQRQSIFTRIGSLGKSVEITADLKTRYNFNSASSVAGRMAGAFLALKDNLTNFVATTCHGFDTHSNEMSEQLPRQKEVAAALSKLLFDLSSTPDPSAPEKMLIDTTTVYITSEFTRTPRFNGTNGTDHWPSASAILCGRGVRDNTVIGKTNTEGYPMAWKDLRPIVSKNGPFLMPGDLVASILTSFGREQEAKQIGGSPIDGLFI